MVSWSAGDEIEGRWVDAGHKAAAPVFRKHQDVLHKNAQHICAENERTMLDFFVWFTTLDHNMSCTQFLYKTRMIQWISMNENVLLVAFSSSFTPFARNAAELALRSITKVATITTHKVLVGILDWLEHLQSTGKSSGNHGFLQVFTGCYRFWPLSDGSFPIFSMARARCRKRSWNSSRPQDWGILGLTSQRAIK